MQNRTESGRAGRNVGVGILGLAILASVGTAASARPQMPDVKWDAVDDGLLANRLVVEIADGVEYETIDGHLFRGGVHAGFPLKGGRWVPLVRSDRRAAHERWKQHTQPRQPGTRSPTNLFYYYPAEGVSLRDAAKALQSFKPVLGLDVVFQQQTPADEQAGAGSGDGSAAPAAAETSGGRRVTTGPGTNLEPLPDGIPEVTVPDFQQYQFSYVNPPTGTGAFQLNEGFQTLAESTDPDLQALAPVGTAAGVRIAVISDQADFVSTGDIYHVDVPDQNLLDEGAGPTTVIRGRAVPISGTSGGVRVQVDNALATLAMLGAPTDDVLIGYDGGGVPIFEEGSNQGVVGPVRGADIIFYSIASDGSPPPTVADAITDLMAGAGGVAPPLVAGDVILIQTTVAVDPANGDFRQLPASWVRVNQQAMDVAQAAGIYTVEIAGDEGLNLDEFVRTSVIAGVGGPGAPFADPDAGGWRGDGLIVGASTPYASTVPQDRTARSFVYRPAASSTFGTAVRAHAPGYGIVTAGYGDLYYDPFAYHQTDYTDGQDGIFDAEPGAFLDTFVGTQASGITVAAAVAQLQALIIAFSDDPNTVLDESAPLPVFQLTDVLIRTGQNPLRLDDELPGSPIGEDPGLVEGGIGVMPDLFAALEALYVSRQINGNLPEVTEAYPVGGVFGDCNNNGIPDIIDVANGCLVTDLDADGIVQPGDCREITRCESVFEPVPGGIGQEPDPIPGQIPGRGPDGPCFADWDSDGTVDFDDIRAFIRSWSSGDPRARIYGDDGTLFSAVTEFNTVWGVAENCN